MKRKISRIFSHRFGRGYAAAALFFCMMTSMMFSMMFSSCTLESSDNGDLDGFWHLEQIDTLATGNSADFSKKYVFWGIEHKLIAVKETDSNKDKFYLRFVQTSDSLKITQAFVNHGHQDNGDDGGDIPVTEVSADLQYFGLNALPEGFQKEALSGSKMILKSKTLRLKFKKF